VDSKCVIVSEWGHLLSSSLFGGLDWSTSRVHMQCAVHERLAGRVSAHILVSRLGPMGP